MALYKPKHVAVMFFYLIMFYVGQIKLCWTANIYIYINPLNAQLNPICHLLALLGAHHIFHVSRIRVNGVLLCKMRKKAAESTQTVIRTSEVVRRLSYVPAKYEARQSHASHYQNLYCVTVMLSVCTAQSNMATWSQSSTHSRPRH
jgi:hypothetical protein